MKRRYRWTLKAVLENPGQCCVMVLEEVELARDSALGGYHSEMTSKFGTGMPKDSSLSLIKL